ncbi:MAG: hypothetical protein KatS3mg070_2304 [Meiothermus sp.]|uniref:hypothetical protein n=1 Tax=unclassified Meiothermus TaxID=370471 RepID=UPI0010221F23|nr:MULTISPECIES: hypothetical protein [unclassified Meiothermus]MCL6567613.1 hypothetical protein [Allomeiothermus silvanus]RYM39440.1 hypothetical protein EWH23_02825 [Meiothermus sp. PNK-Is4]GIW28941.1 MAG: hypothetical protein KatS3mg070_2304 [Meiothermus sp.]
MKVLSYPRFPYPNLWRGYAWCDVDVYRLGREVLVVLRDQNDHGGTSLTNALERVARKVRQELLEPAGLAGLETRWIEWSRVDKIASRVEFRDPEALEGPCWQYLPPEEFARILEGFEAPDPLEEWIREGALRVEEWEETRDEPARRRPD